MTPALAATTQGVPLALQGSPHPQRLAAALGFLAEHLAAQDFQRFITLLHTTFSPSLAARMDAESPTRFHLT
jgi:hypothetical protein